MNELSQAYWISPKGKIFKSEKHIDDVIRNPKAFGYTIDESQLPLPKGRGLNGNV